MNEKTMKEFLYAYVDKMVELMAEHSYGVSAMGINCAVCPFHDLCHNSEDTGIGCEQFILNQLTDGNKYRV